MTLANVPAAIRNLSQANANLRQAARLLTDDGYADHAARVTGWAEEIAKLAQAGIVTVKAAAPASPKPRATARTTPTHTPTEGSAL